VVLDTPSPLIVVPSRLIDPFVGIRTVRFTYCHFREFQLVFTVSV